jgi:hypothetical protein
MRHFSRVIVLVILGLGLVSAGSTSLAEEKEKAPPKPYPLTTCIVSDEPLNSMGGPVTIVHEGQEIKFCCGHCVKPFRQDPPKYLKKLENAPSTQPAE